MVGARLKINYIGAGVKTDFDKLLSLYCKEKSVRYEVFAAIWKKLRMSLIFSLRQTDYECREFAEECFKIAQMFIAPNCDLQTQVCGLYIVYALYYKQPCTPRAQIRVCPDQWQNLLYLLQEAREQKHLDVEYVLQTLLVDNAFTFTATPDFMIPEKAQNTSEQDDMKEALESALSMAENSVINDVLQSDSIDQLSSIHEQYHMMKCSLGGASSSSSSKPPDSLNCIKPNLVQQLTKLVAQHQERRKVLAGRGTKRTRRDSGQTTSESEADSDSDVPTSPKRQRHGDRSQSTGARRAAIKARAYSTVKVTNRRKRRQAQMEASLSSPEPRPDAITDVVDEDDFTVITQPVSLPNMRSSMLSMPHISGESSSGSPKKGKRRKIGQQKAKAKVTKSRKKPAASKPPKAAPKSPKTASKQPKPSIKVALKAKKAKTGKAKAMNTATVATETVTKARSKETKVETSANEAERPAERSWNEAMRSLIEAEQALKEAERVVNEAERPGNEAKLSLNEAKQAVSEAERAVKEAERQRNEAEGPVIEAVRPGSDAKKAAAKNRGKLKKKVKVQSKSEPARPKKSKSKQPYNTADSASSKQRSSPRRP